jgi:hypothetical protein
MDRPILLVFLGTAAGLLDLTGERPNWFSLVEFRAAKSGFRKAFLWAWNNHEGRKESVVELERFDKKGERVKEGTGRQTHVTCCDSLFLTDLWWSPPPST